MQYIDGTTMRMLKEFNVTLPADEQYPMNMTSFMNAYANYSDFRNPFENDCLSRFEQKIGSELEQAYMSNYSQYAGEGSVVVKAVSTYEPLSVSINKEATITGYYGLEEVKEFLRGR